MISFVFDRSFQWLYFDILEPYGRLLLFGGFYFGFFVWKIYENVHFFGRIWPDLGL